MFGLQFMVENKLSGQREMNNWVETSTNIRHDANLWSPPRTESQYRILGKGYRMVWKEFNCSVLINL